MIRVLIVDDSAVVRQTLSQILSSDPVISVMGTASDPFMAAKKIMNEIPDVITLDVEMPRMDGITFLRKIMEQHPIPVVICSSQAESGSDNAFKALEYGAVDIIEKPRIGTKQFLEESKILICDAVKAARLARINKKERKKEKMFDTFKVQPKHTADVMLQKPIKARHIIQTTERVIALGASTGGTEAIKVFLEAMPIDCPGIVIVQHMPEKFTRSFAERLNTICDITVKEAKDNDTVLPGQALIAPGNKHTLLKRSGARYYVEVKDGPLVNRHRPSVDVLFRSAAQYAGKNAIGVILTGMGDDGARGMKEMNEAGAYTVAQDELSCIVFGMPKEAISHGGVDKVISLSHIAPHVLNIKNK